MREETFWPNSVTRERWWSWGLGVVGWRGRFEVVSGGVHARSRGGRAWGRDARVGGCGGVVWGGGGGIRVGRKEGGGEGSCGGGRGGRGEDSVGVFPEEATRGGEGGRQGGKGGGRGV